MAADIHPKAADAKACAERARWHNREKNRHRDLAREERKRQVALEAECRRLGIALHHEPYDTSRLGETHGRTHPRSHHRP